MAKYLSVTLPLLLLPFHLVAEPNHHKHSRTQLDAHLHGIAELTLALEGDSLEINLASPAANIVGFEHQARSAKQVKAVENAKSVLESANTLFSFSGSHCALKHADVDVSTLMLRKTTNESDHDDEHHHHSHKHNETKKEAHSEITASYYYKCQQGEKVSTVTVDLVSHFPAIEKINTMWLTDQKQGAVELNSKSNLIHLK